MYLKHKQHECNYEVFCIHPVYIHTCIQRTGLTVLGFGRVLPLQHVLHIVLTAHQQRAHGAVDVSIASPHCAIYGAMHLPSRGVVFQHMQTDRATGRFRRSHSVYTAFLATAQCAPRGPAIFWTLWERCPDATLMAQGDITLIANVLQL